MSAFKSAKATRDLAKSAFDDRLNLVRGDLAERSVGGRLTDAVVGETADVGLQAIEVVEAHKLIAVGTLTAIAMWFLRNPIIAAGRRLSGRLKRRGRGVWL